MGSPGKKIITEQELRDNAGKTRKELEKITGCTSAGVNGAIARYGLKHLYPRIKKIPVLTKEYLTARAGVVSVSEIQAETGSKRGQIYARIRACGLHKEYGIQSQEDCEMSLSRYRSKRDSKYTPITKMIKAPCMRCGKLLNVEVPIDYDEKRKFYKACSRCIPKSEDYGMCEHTVM